mmetsp:Transcript_17768/g.57546  ORF Transcript_17768/g.57546 Transcript_17768/m.57546 type:complete len:274 (+) Transcript_17768:624-1445(+)
MTRPNRRTAPGRRSLRAVVAAGSAATTLRRRRNWPSRRSDARHSPVGRHASSDETAYPRNDGSLLAVRDVVGDPLRGSPPSTPGEKKGLEASIAAVALLIERDASGDVTSGHRDDGPLARRGSPSAANWRCASLLFRGSAEECLRRLFADGTTRPERRTTHPRDDGSVAGNRCAATGSTGVALLLTVRDDVEAPRRRPRRKRTSIDQAIFAFGDERTTVIDERTSLLTRRVSTANAATSRRLRKDRVPPTAVVFALSSRLVQRAPSHSISRLT